jgi:two-component sensor histidine kinase
MLWTSLVVLSRRRPGPWSWVVALLLFTASLALYVLLSPPQEGLRFLIFYSAVAASALIGGWLHGVVVLILSAVSAWYLLIEPIKSFAFNDPAAVSPVITFLLVGVFIVLLVAALRETVRRLEQAKHLQETLFRELQHRVANNLQMVVALLRNAQRNLRNPAAAAEKLTQAEERILAMSQLHRRLHDGTAHANGIESILQEMLEETFRDFDVDLALDVEEEADLSIDQLTAMTLLVHEAALNAAKHVFREGKGSHFEVSLSKQENGRLRLFIRDDGPGIDPQKTAETRTMRSLGISIMQAFATQLGGTLQFSGDSGTIISVEFAAT